MMARALEKWKTLPREERLLPEGEQTVDLEARRPERFYPEGGLVLRVYTRDLPREQAAAEVEHPSANERQVRTSVTEASMHEHARNNGASRGPLPNEERPDWRARAWNQDFAWFRKEEAREFLPLLTEIGAKHEVPAFLVQRIARAHLVDNVRGQTTAFREEDVQRARMTAQVTAVEGYRVSLRLEGETRTEAEGIWSVRGYRDMNNPAPRKRGLEMRLLGYATYDRVQQRFVAFEMVALGTRWGGTQYNGRGDDLDPAPIGALFTLAGDTPAERVAPAHLRAYGWEP